MGNFQGSGAGGIQGIGMVEIDEPGSEPGTTPHVDLDVPALLGVLSTPVGLTVNDFRVEIPGLLNAAGDGFLSTFSMIPTGEVIQWLNGDANGDGVVSAGDYASVQANFGATGIAVSGDANGDGVVSAGDYASVQANFGQTAVSSMISGSSMIPQNIIPAEISAMMPTSSESINSIPSESATTVATIPTIPTIPTIVDQTAREVRFIEPAMSPVPIMPAIETAATLAIEPMSIAALSYEFADTEPIDSFYADGGARGFLASELKTKSTNQQLSPYENAADIFSNLDIFNILEADLIDIF